MRIANLRHCVRWLVVLLDLRLEGAVAEDHDERSTAGCSKAADLQYDDSPETRVKIKKKKTFLHEIFSIFWIINNNEEVAMNDIECKVVIDDNG